MSTGNNPLLTITAFNSFDLSKGAFFTEELPLNLPDQMLVFVCERESI